ncbi:MAG: hypothetical protein JW772_03535, partial [Candidatus Diapherotrites archaeon]|nr:hypothetical protein [Candidatus Diapherotrites archaeon]
MVIAENNAELREAEKAVKKMHPKDRILHLGAGSLDTEGRSIARGKPTDLLEKKDLITIEEKSSLLARNWYRLNKEFMKKTCVLGISLGFLSENEMSVFLRENLIRLKALKILMRKGVVDSVIVNKNSASGILAEDIAKTNGFKDVQYLEMPKQKQYSHFTNFSARKMREIRKALPEIFREKPKKGKKTVFIKSRGYLGNLERELEKENDLEVESLDNFFMTNLVNPKKILNYFSDRISFRKKFRKHFAELARDPKFRKKISFEGIGFSRIIESRFSQLAERDWPEFAFVIKTLAELFEKKQPKAVVL